MAIKQSLPEQRVCRRSDPSTVPALSAGARRDSILSHCLRTILHEISPRSHAEITPRSHAEIEIAIAPFDAAVEDVAREHVHEWREALATQPAAHRALRALRRRLARARRGALGGRPLGGRGRGGARLRAGLPLQVHHATAALRFVVLRSGVLRSRGRLEGGVITWHLRGHHAAIRW